MMIKHILIFITLITTHISVAAQSKKQRIAELEMDIDSLRNLTFQLNSILDSCKSQNVALQNELNLVEDSCKSLNNELKIKLRQFQDKCSKQEREFEAEIDFNSRKVDTLNRILEVFGSMMPKSENDYGESDLILSDLYQSCVALPFNISKFQDEKLGEIISIQSSSIGFSQSEILTAGWNSKGTLAYYVLNWGPCGHPCSIDLIVYDAINDKILEEINYPSDDWYSQENLFQHENKSLLKKELNQILHRYDLTYTPSLPLYYREVFGSFFRMGSSIIQLEYRKNEVLLTQTNSHDETTIIRKTNVIENYEGWEGVHCDSRLLIKGYFLNPMNKDQIVIELLHVFPCGFENEVEYSSEFAILNVASKPNQILVGSKIWMTENLNVDTFRNGEIIPQATSAEEWERAGMEGRPAWCYYENDFKNGKKYGRLYNWYAVMDSRGLAPEGWRVPTSNDFTDLYYSLTEDKIWLNSENKGLCIIPSGDRNSEGEFYHINESCHLWTASMNNVFNASYQLFGEIDGYAALYDDNRGAGFSVRCVRENTDKEGYSIIDNSAIHDEENLPPPLDGVPDSFEIVTESISGVSYMKDNLRSRTFRNGDPILVANSKSEWLEACQNNVPACCFYNFDANLKDLGYLYNYFAFVDERNLAPKGFRLLEESDILPENLPVLLHGGTLAGGNGSFFGMNEFSLFWSKCADDFEYLDHNCFWKILPENSPMYFEQFPHCQGMFVRCIGIK